MPNNHPISELIKDYAERAREIYDNRTIGDYTFEGLLASFLSDVKRETPGNDHKI